MTPVSSSSTGLRCSSGFPSPSDSLHSLAPSLQLPTASASCQAHSCWNTWQHACRHTLRAASAMFSKSNSLSTLTSTPCSAASSSSQGSLPLPFRMVRLGSKPAQECHTRTCVWKTAGLGSAERRSTLTPLLLQLPLFPDCSGAGMHHTVSPAQPCLSAHVR